MTAVKDSMVFVKGSLSKREGGSADVDKFLCFKYYFKMSKLG